MKKKYDIIVLTDEIPGFVSLELAYFASKGLEVLVFTDAIDAKSVKPNIIQIKTEKKSSIFLKLKLIFKLIFNYSLLKEFNEKSVKANFLKLKIAVDWLIRATNLKHQIENQVQLDTATFIYSFWGNEKGLCAALLKQEYQLHSLVRLHGFDLYAERYHLQTLPTYLFQIQTHNHIVFISQHGEQYFLRNYPSSKGKTSLNYLGTNANFINKFDKIQSRNAIKIVSCSSLIPLKRVHLIFEAMVSLKEKGLNIEWIHFGGGQQLKHFEELVSKGNYASFITLKGNVANSEIHEYYNNTYIDLFINVSETEGLPVSIMEAMSYGIPSIATQVGGTAEIVMHGENGYLLSANLSKDDLVNQCIQFFSLDKESQFALRKNARNLWELKFNAKENVNLFFQDKFKELNN